MKDLTRRQLGAQISLVIAGAATAATAIAQTPPDWYAQAVQSKNAAAADLAKFEIGIAVEPAFQFKA
jgi:hypothetical protein